MLLQRQQLRDHLKGCIEEAHQMHIPCARSPIGYLECPLHSSEENISPHIQLGQLTTTGDVICPKSMNYCVIPKEAYALLFVASLTSSKSYHCYCIEEICTYIVFKPGARHPQCLVF